MSEDAHRKAALAKEASYRMALAAARQTSGALAAIARGLHRKKRLLMRENRRDMENAARSGAAHASLGRLELSDEKFSEIIHEVRAVKAQKGAAGTITSRTILDSGLELEKVAVPLGVVLAVFESRPDALVQISALAIKTGNAAILKGGKEARNTNLALARIIRAALMESGLPKDAIQLIESRETLQNLLKMDSHIDMVIPRGGSSLVKYIQENSRIPVLAHASGVCHEYVDAHADIGKAVKVCVDAKCNYPAACNSMETLLAHRKIAGKFLPLYAKTLGGKVELRADREALKILRAYGFEARKARESDWGTEYNAPVLAVKTVGSTEEAIRHINAFGSRHTDGIITEKKSEAEKFLQGVDSAGVYWNASTRFADGYRYGKGAEVGISTGKIHARGPSGEEALLTYKYILKGDGHAVADYMGKNARKFLHRKVRVSRNG